MIFEGIFKQQKWGEALDVLGYFLLSPGTFAKYSLEDFPSAKAIYFGIRVQCLAKGSIEIRFMGNSSISNESKESHKVIDQHILYCSPMEAVSAVIKRPSREVTHVKVLDHSFGQILVTMIEKAYMSEPNESMVQKDIEGDLPSDLETNMIMAAERIRENCLIEAIRIAQDDKHAKALKALLIVILTILGTFLLTRVFIFFQSRRLRRQMDRIRVEVDARAPTEESMVFDRNSKIDPEKYKTNVTERKAGTNQETWEDAR